MPVVKDPYINMREHEVEALRREVERLKDMIRNLCIGHADDCDCYCCEAVFMVKKK